MCAFMLVRVSFLVCLFLFFLSDKADYKSTVQGDALRAGVWSHGPFSQNQTFVQIKLRSGEIELHSHDHGGTKDNQSLKPKRVPWVSASPVQVYF